MDTDPEPESNMIRYETYFRFKGCESYVIILIDVDPEDRNWNKKALYTAMSRAKFLLYVLYK